MKHILRFMKHLVTFLVFVLPLTILGWVILYPALLLLPKEATSLPRYLRWFDNVDGDGLIGDTINVARNLALGVDPFGVYAKYKWIAFRNPIQGFKYLVLGMPNKEGMQSYYDTKVELPSLLVGDYTTGGYVIHETTVNNTRYYEYYYIKPYRLFNKSVCVRARFGWKLAGQFDRPRENISWTFAFNPFHTYRGQYLT